jgi:hypothetical protein
MVQDAEKTMSTGPDTPPQSSDHPSEPNKLFNTPAEKADALLRFIVSERDSFEADIQDKQANVEEAKKALVHAQEALASIQAERIGKELKFGIEQAMAGTASIFAELQEKGFGDLSEDTVEDIIVQSSIVYTAVLDNNQPQNTNPEGDWLNRVANLVSQKDNNSLTIIMEVILGYELSAEQASDLSVYVERRDEFKPENVEQTVQWLLHNASNDRQKLFRSIHHLRQNITPSGTNADDRIIFTTEELQYETGNTIGSALNDRLTPTIDNMLGSKFSINQQTDN